MNIVVSNQDVASQIAAKVVENLYIPFVYNNKQWSLLSQSDLSKIDQHIQSRLAPLIRAHANDFQGEGATEKIEKIAGMRVLGDNFDVVRGKNLTVTGLTQVFYNATRVWKGNLMKGFMPSGSEPPDQEPTPMLYIDKMPSDQEIRRVFLTALQ